MMHNYHNKSEHHTSYLFNPLKIRNKARKFPLASCYSCLYISFEDHPLLNDVSNHHRSRIAC